MTIKVPNRARKNDEPWFSALLRDDPHAIDFVKLISLYLCNKAC